MGILGNHDPTHIIGVTISSLEYVGVNQLYVVHRATLKSTSTEVIEPLARNVSLPATYGEGIAQLNSKSLNIRIEDSETAGERVTRIRARTQDITLDVFTPFYERVATTKLLVLSGETHQCFGTWSGTYTHPDGTLYSLNGLEGWAEEAQYKW